MGCWNQTCGLTNLHITNGQDVVVFAMVKVEKVDSLCYTTPFYEPIMMPFYAKYNDYGGGEDSTGIGYPIVMEAIRDRLVELPQGENQYHDIPVKKEGFAEEAFFDAIHERRLFVMGKRPNSRRHVEMVMFHKNVWDNILENRVVEQYVGEQKGNTGYSNSYIEYRFSDIVAKLPEVIATVMRNVNDESNPFRFYEPFRNLRSDVALETNLAAQVLANSDSYRYGRMLDTMGRTVEYSSANDVAGLTEFVTEYMKALWIDSFMMSTRKFWSPQSGAGSQGQDHDGYRLLIDSMTKVLDAEKEQWAEWADE